MCVFGIGVYFRLVLVESSRKLKAHLKQLAEYQHERSTATTTTREAKNIQRPSKYSSSLNKYIYNNEMMRVHETKMFGIKMDKLNKKREYKNQADARKRMWQSEKEKERKQKHSQWLTKMPK